MSNSMVSVAQQEGTFQGNGDLRLYYKRWLPAEGRPQATLVISHGNGEHAGCYDHVARYFAARGVAVYGMDHRGYGRSGGVRGHVNHFEEYLADLRLFMGLVIDYHSAAVKPVLLGHSLGGLIALRYAQRYPDTVRALILSSPWLALQRPVPAATRLMLGMLTYVAPRMHLGVSSSGPDLVRRDPAVIRAVASDPLRVRRMTPRWYAEVVRAQQAAVDAATELGVPSLWLQAGTDHVVSAAAAKVAYDRVALSDKTFNLYPEAYHELFNEPEAERTHILGAIAQWLQARGILVSGG